MVIERNSYRGWYDEKLSRVLELEPEVETKGDRICELETENNALNSTLTSVKNFLATSEDSLGKSSKQQHGAQRHERAAGSAA